MDKCTWINPRKLNSKLAVRKLENQLILPFVSYPKTQKRHQKVEKMGLKTGEMVDSAEAAIQVPDLETCSHMEVPAPLTQPLTPLQQDAGALVPGEGKIVSLKWETPVHLRCGCCVKSRGIGKHVYTEALFTNLPSKMLATRVFSFKQETEALVSQESASPKRKTERQWHQEFPDERVQPFHCTDAPPTCAKLFLI